MARFCQSSSHALSVLYCTVALDTDSNFCPAVLIARNANRLVPGARLTCVVSVLEVVLNFFTPSTHSSMSCRVPETVPAACAVTGELTVDPFTGLQMFTPGLTGGWQPVAAGVRPKFTVVVW